MFCGDGFDISKEKLVIVSSFKVNSGRLVCGIVRSGKLTSDALKCCTLKF